MQCSVEISMYPLDKNYIEPIISFIKKIRSYPNLSVETNGMSTQIFGQYDDVMNVLQVEIKNCFELHEKVVFNLKVINSSLQEKPKF